MSREAFDALVSRLLDDEAAREDLDRLAGMLQDHPEWIPEIRRELRLAERIAQQIDATRSEGAFVASMETRLAAERDGARFVAATSRRIEDYERGAGRRRHRRLAIAGIAAAAMLMALAGVAWRFGRLGSAVGSSVIAEIVEIRGNPTLRSPEFAARVAVVGDRVAPGGALATGEGDEATIRYRDGTSVALREGGDLGLDAPEPESAAPSKRLHLARGALVCEAAGQPRGAPMTIRTPHARISMLGTRCTLLVVKRFTRCDVQSGLVRFTRRSDGRTVDLAAGQFAVAADDIEPVALKSPGRELSPKYGGVFFKEFADVYGRDGFSLRRDSRLGEVPRTVWSGETIRKRLAADAGARLTFTFPDGVPTILSDSGKLETCRLPIDDPGPDAVEYEMIYRIRYSYLNRTGRCHWSTLADGIQDFKPDELPPKTAPFDESHRDKVDDGRSDRMETSTHREIYRLVGATPSGRSVYERLVLWDERPARQHWCLGTLRGLLFQIQNMKAAFLDINLARRP